MIATDEDALLCDMAETYHIYDMYSFPVLYIATLAKGLSYRENSRIMMSLNGLSVEIKTLLLARICDSSAINVWFQTEDGQKGFNRPQSMVQLLTKQNKKDEVGFDSGDEFEKKWREIVGE